MVCQFCLVYVNMVGLPDPVILAVHSNAIILTIAVNTVYIRNTRRASRRREENQTILPLDRIRGLAVELAGVRPTQPNSRPPWPSCVSKEPKWR